MLQIYKLIVLFLFFFLTTSNNALASGPAVHQVNVTVNGNIIISNYGSDFTGLNALQQVVNLDSISEEVFTGCRIRTNFNKWQVAIQKEILSEYSNESIEKNINVQLVSRVGHNADPKSFILNRAFITQKTLEDIPKTQMVLLNGISKTSKKRDANNKNNWIELVTSYKFKNGVEIPVEPISILITYYAYNI